MQRTQLKVPIILPFVLLSPGNHSAAKTTTPRAQNMTFAPGLLGLSPFGCRLADTVGLDPAVFSATGAGTTVSAVTVTTEPLSCVEVKTSSEVIDCVAAEGEEVE